MNPLIESASRSAAQIAKLLEWFETQSAPLQAQKSHEGLAERIASTWLRAVRDVDSEDFCLREAYLSELYQHLMPIRSVEGIAFSDEGMSGSWAQFVEDMTCEHPAEAVWVLAQLCWGRHVQIHAFSFAWIVSNGVRLQNGRPALLPPREKYSELFGALQAAGPGTWDAETLRSMMSTLELEQAR